MVSRRGTNPHRLASSSSSSLTVSSVAERANHFFKASEECSNFGTGPSLRPRPPNKSTSKRQSSGSKRVDLSIRPRPSASARPSRPLICTPIQIGPIIVVEPDESVRPDSRNDDRPLPNNCCPQDRIISGTGARSSSLPTYRERMVVPHLKHP